MTADIEIRNVSKRYGAMTVLDGLSLSIRANEFMVFLGPSGCGKSTLLRMIAGLESVDEGSILINGERIDTLAPGQRDVAMVFQSYALYPHMTVADNMAFGLRNIHLAKDVISARVAEAARMLEIGHLLERKPGQLSGGQRQRVAIGRAIVKEPKAFLFDEPLSNLDAALRVRTRVELAQLRNRVKSTMIFVTHDQIEAMTLADRIVVMNNRKIEQIGSPTMNFQPVAVEAREGFAVATLRDGATLATTIRAGGIKAGEYTLGIRAEAVKLSKDGSKTTTGKVDVLERLGDRTLLYIRLKDGSLLVAEDIGNSRVAIGDEVPLALDGGRTHLFDADGLAWHGEEGGHV